MCYSPHASLVAFVVNSCTCLVLMHYNLVLGLFLFYVGIMQLYDLIFWTHQVENAVNYWITKLAMITNNLQPLVLAALVVTIGKKRLSIPTWTVVCVYALVLLWAIPYSWNRITYTMVTPESAPSLYWQWNYLPWSTTMYSLYMLAFLMVMWDGLEWPMNTFVILLTIVSFVLSQHYYKGKTSTGRFWCYFAAWTPLIIVAFELLGRGRRPP